MESKDDAQHSALVEVDEGRATLSARVVSPRWYLPLMGLLAAQHVLVQGAADVNWTLPSGLLLIVGSAGAWLLWRGAMGITVWPVAGWRSALALGTWSLGIGFYVWTAALSREGPVVVAAAIAALVVTAPLGRVWETALRGDLARVDGWAP